MIFVWGFTIYWNPKWCYQAESGWTYEQQHIRNIFKASNHSIESLLPDIVITRTIESGA